MFQGQGGGLEALEAFCVAVLCRDPLAGAAVEAEETVVGDAVVRGQQVQGLQFRRREEGVMAVHRQGPLPFFVAHDPQHLAVTGHVGGASGVHMQTLCGGTSLRAAVFKVTTVSCRDKNKQRER